MLVIFFGASFQQFLFVVRQERYFFPHLADRETEGLKVIRYIPSRGRTREPQAQGFIP